MQQTEVEIKDKSSIFIDGVLFDLDSYWWKGFVQLEAKDIEIIKEEIPDVVQLGKVRILKHESFKDFQEIESKSRLAVERYSYPFMISTVRFVPYTVLPDLVSVLEDLKRAFRVYVDLFILNYEDNKKNFVIRYPKLQEHITDRYPNVLNLRSKYYFGWTFFEMAMPEGIRAEVVNSLQLELLQSSWNNSQEEVQRRLDNWVDDIAKIMRKEILNTCKSMRDSIEAGNVVRESTLERSRETIKRIRTMNFIDDDQVNLILDDLQQSLPNNSERDIPAIALTFKNNLEAILKEAGDLSDISEFTGQYKRKLIL